MSISREIAHKIKAIQSHYDLKVLIERQGLEAVIPGLGPETRLA